MILGRFFAILFFFISFTFGGINYYYFLEGMYFPKLLFTFIFSLMNMFIFSFFPGPKVNFFDASNPKFNWKEDWFFKSKKKERIIWIFGNFLSIIIYILLDEYFQEGNPFSIKSLFTFLIVIIIGFIMVKLSKFTIFEERWSLLSFLQFFVLTISVFIFFWSYIRKNQLVKLRLQRTGTKNEPHYRVVVADSRYPRDGRFIEIVGQYHPVNNKDQIIINSEKALGWLSKGAQPTNTVLSLLKKAGIWAQFRATQTKAKA